MLRGTGRLWGRKVGIVVMPRAFNQPREVPINKAPSIRENVAKGFPVRLRAARITAGYTDATDFARQMGIQAPRYRRWEAGTAEPSIANLVRLCELLSTDANFLILGKKSKV